MSLSSFRVSKPQQLELKMPFYGSIVVIKRSGADESTYVLMKEVPTNFFIVK